MPHVFLAPDPIPESGAIEAAAVRAGYPVQRLHSSEVPASLRGLGGAYYGPFSRGVAVAPKLGITLLAAPPDWLPGLPEEYRLRDPGAEPVPFAVEFRCFVCRRQAVTVAPYARSGQPEGQGSASEGMGAAELLLRLLRDPRVALAPGLVIDVGRIDGRGWAVVEARPAWSSALYGCNPDRALSAIVASCS